MKEFTNWENQSAVERELIRALKLANDEVSNTNFGRVAKYLEIASKCIEVLQK